MQPLCWLIFLSGAYPLARAFRANRHTSLIHATGWAALAWLGWGGAMAAASWPDLAPAARYAGLCLIGCAGVAVLGARRPGVDAWNAVVAGLLGVLLLALAEGALTGGEVQLGPVRAIFLGGILAVGVLNYLPTRRGFAAVLLGAGCALEVWGLGAVSSEIGASVADLLFALVPWAALCTGWGRTTSEVDRLWLNFRDRFGLVWGQRVREQFNRAVRHAGLPLELGWSGLRCRDRASPSDAGALVILHALMKRFGPAADREETAPLEYERDTVPR